MIIDILDPRANRDEQLFCHYVFKFLRIKLSKSPEDVDLLAAPECELGLKEGFDHMSLVLQLGADGRYHLASVDTGRCAQGPSKDTAHICLESISSSTIQHPADAGNVEGVEPHFDENNHTRM